MGGNNGNSKKYLYLTDSQKQLSLKDLFSLEVLIKNLRDDVLTDTVNRQDISKFGFKARSLYDLFNTVLHQKSEK